MSFQKEKQFPPKATNPSSTEERERVTHKSAAMEIQGSDGSITRLKPNSNTTTVFGRANGFHSTDLSVSRRHLSFDFNPQTSPRVSFEVLGKNPVWVFFNKQNQNGNKIKVFKRFERGELDIDDMFCVSPKTPIWYSLKKVVANEGFEERESKNEGINERFSEELSQCLESVSGFDGNEDLGLDSVHLSNIDPVQEFGFLVIGHEFDHYPKQMLREVSQWNWFLDDPRKGDTDDEEDTEMKVSAGVRGKRKKRREGDDDVDEEWTAKSEGEEVSTNLRKVPRPNTRSKEHGVRQKRTTNRSSSTKTSSSREEEEESEDEDDETLGGFVVHDDTMEEEEDDETDEEEEEEFVEDEDELEE